MNIKIMHSKRSNRIMMVDLETNVVFLSLGPDHASHEFILKEYKDILVEFIPKKYV